jgi:hypothetical protein
MDAIIIDTNLVKGRAVARTTDGEYVLIELFTDEPELHDEIKGKFDEHPLGDLIIRNITSGEKMEVYIQNYCSEELAKNYLQEE